MLIYHVYNRGVDKRKIYLDKWDHMRFVYDLFDFNDENNTLPSPRRKNDVRRRTREKLVDIHAFCLMPNHYHLLISAKDEKEDGISRFMKKVNGGYAKYFNEKYKRSGALFEGRFKRILVESDSHLNRLPNYIHFNPLDLFDSGWRNGRVMDVNNSIEFLKQYKWSSFLDYIGHSNYPGVISSKFLMEILGGTHKYKIEVLDMLEQMNVSQISDIILEEE